MPRKDPPTGDSDIQESLAALIRSTRTTRRHLSLTDIADWLDVAIDGLGSLREVADRIDLSEKMLKQFQYVRRLTPTVQDMFASRQIDSVDIAVHLSMLEDKEQIEVAERIVSGDLNSADVRAIRELKKEALHLSIADVIEKVEASRDIKQYAAEFVIRSRRVDEESIKDRFARVLDRDNIISLSLSGSIGKIVMSNTGWSLLQRYSKKHNLTRAQTISTIAKGEVK